MGMMISISLSSFIVFYFLQLVLGFNIDVKTPVKISGYASDGSFFGYATAMVKTDTGVWILVGAPRGNDSLMPDVKRPGKVYRCQLDNTRNPNCSSLDIDHKNGIEDVTYLGKTYTLNNGREDSWMGGTLSVGPDKEFLTCAPKWYQKNVGSYYMYGMCYLVPLDFNMEKVQKIPVYETQVTVKIGGRSVHNFPFSEFGLAAQYIMEDSGSSHLQIGSPGLLDWMGGFVDIHDGQLLRMENNVNTTAIAKPYIGSAFSNGKYFMDGLIYTVVASPREDMTGVVVLFPLTDVKYVYQSPSLIIPGRDEENMDLPPSSYFGATLCTVDVNNDGADDLLIGAPLHSAQTNNIFNENIDIGLVSVHFGSRELNTFNESTQLLKGMVPYGRFGTAITSLGDINKDTFPDVAIAAPYENDYEGTVYIYNGYSDGLWPKYSQKIQASNTGIAGFGFGISISSEKDLNADGVQDVVIGSYLSDDVMVLFGQPIIALEGLLTIQDSNSVQTQFVEVNERNKSVKICMKFDDRYCSHIELNVVTDLDIAKTPARLIFADTNDRKVVDVLKLNSGITACTPKHRFIAVNTLDYKSDIVVRADYSLKEIDCSSYDVTPILNRFDGRHPADDMTMLQNRTYFKLDCVGSICNSNLNLKAKAIYDEIDGYFVLGKQALKVDVHVTKTGDPAYGTLFHFVYPSYINYQKVETTLGEATVVCFILLNHNDSGIVITEDQTALQCKLGNPLREDEGVKFQIYLQVPRDIQETSMYLRMNVTTANNEQVLSDNGYSVDISMKHVVEASFEGNVANDGSHKFTHVFELDNRGPSSITAANMKIGYPQYVVDGKALMYLNTTQVNCVGTCEVKCYVKEKHTVEPVHYQNSHTYSLTLGKYRNVESNIQKLNCAEKSCETLDCELKNIPALSSLTVYLRFVMDNGLQKSLKNGNVVTW
ncbi:Integrin [Mactra antiquata]